MNDKRLIYIWDAYCGWCYGFSNSLRAFYENHQDIPLDVISGGLFVEGNKQPIGQFPHITNGNKRIAQLTGANFGSSYQSLQKKGQFVMDSDKAAQGFSVLRSAAPEKIVDITSSMQKAFYENGKSLSDPETYREIANNLGLDADTIVNQLETATTIKEAKRDFEKVANLGIQSYPTLLFKQGNQIHVIGSGVMTPDKIETRLNELL